MTELDKLIAFIYKTLVRSGELRFEEDPPYSSLPLCVIDAVYSMGVRYESTVRTVVDFCAWAGWTDNRERSIGELISLLSPYENRWESLASQVFRNRQRTSSKSGILKAQAVYLFAATVKNFHVDVIADLARIDLDAGLHEAIRGIPGQATGTCFKYFLMLAQRNDFVKPDRMLIRFVAEALGVPSVEPNTAETLVKAACFVLQREFPTLLASRLDYAIWRYQRQASVQRAPAQPLAITEATTRVKPKDFDGSLIELPENAAALLIRCYVCPLGRQTPEGLEAVELYVCHDFKSRVAQPELGSRTNIRLKVGPGIFQGGLRTYPSKRREVYVCPNLLSERNGSKISLAKLLRDSGIEPKAEVDVRIANGVWEIIGSAKKMDLV